MDELLQTAAILLVDDSWEDRILLRHALHRSRIGNPLIEFRDGVDAVDFLSALECNPRFDHNQIPFLMLLDLRMPKLSGCEVIEWVRGRAALNRMIVVVLTDSDDVTELSKAFELGADSYFVKPGDPDELSAMMNRIDGSLLLFATRRNQSSREGRQMEAEASPLSGGNP